MPRFPLELPLQTPQWLLRNERGILLLILSLGCLVQIIVTLFTNGGGDLQYAYVPTVMSILHGQNPYLSGQPWNTGYPPFFFLFLAGLALLGSLGGSMTLATVSWSLRIGLVIGHVALGGLAYLTLRRMKIDILARLAVPALIVLLPSFYQMGEVWFHADVFGLVLLVGAVYLLCAERWITGSLLLSLSAAFKIHPILALPLVAIWLFPLRQLFHYYAFWAIIPFMLRGNLKQMTLALLPFEAACDLAAYAWTVRPDWVLSQQSTGLLLSMLDMILLVASIAACAFLVLRTSILEQRIIEAPIDRLEVLAPVPS